MAASWISSVKGSGQLSYHLDSSVTGQWLMVVQEAVQEFNRLAGTNNLGVTFIQSNDPPTDSGGADLGIATGNGGVTYVYSGTRSTTINGSALQGRTLLISRENSPIEKAFMFLPSQPMIYTVSARRRAVGVGVMKIIALHELIHVCGLNDGDHTNEDVFNGHPSADPGRNAAHDRIQIRVNGKYHFMPPIIFSSTTASKIQRLWT